MKPSGNTIKLLIAALCCVCIPLLSGCIKEDVAIEYPENVMLQMSVGTRAVTETDGTPANAEEAIKSLRIYAFVDGEPIGHEFIENPKLQTVVENGVTKNFYSLLMDVKVYESYRNRDDNMIPVDFYLIANEEGAHYGGNPLDLDEGTSESKLNSMSITGLTPANGLLMYAKEMDVLIDMTKNSATGPNSSHSNYNDHKDHTMIDGNLTFSLRRPFGKLGVFAAKAEGETATLTITSLKMLSNGTVSNNYVMPRDLSSGLNFNVGEIDLNGNVDVVVNETIASTDDREDPANYTPVLVQPYYPFENPYGTDPDVADSWKTSAHDNGNVLEIKWKFEGKAEQTGKVYLPPVNRNEYCMVNCLFNNSGKLTIHYTVVPWEVKVWDDIKYQYPSYESLALESGGNPTENDKPVCWFTGSDVGSFRALFKMTAPEYQTWTPTLMDATSEEFELKVYSQSDLSKELTADQMVASATPYIIQVRPLQSVSEDRIVTFAITFRPSWDQNDLDLLYINGNPGEGGSDEDKTIWPDGGTNCRFLEIKQLAKAPTGN